MSNGKGHTPRLPEQAEQGGGPTQEDYMIIRLRIPTGKVAQAVEVVEKNLEREEGETDQHLIRRYFINHLVELDYRHRRRQHTVVPDDTLIQEEP